MTPEHWQARRRMAHEEGRHVTPQIDCRRCWDSGALHMYDPPEPPADPVPIHDGRHGRTCLACHPV